MGIGLTCLIVSDHTPPPAASASQPRPSPKPRYLWKNDVYINLVNWSISYGLKQFLISFVTLLEFLFVPRKFNTLYDNKRYMWKSHFFESTFSSFTGCLKQSNQRWSFSSKWQKKKKPNKKKLEARSLNSKGSFPYTLHLTIKVQ